MPQRDVGGLLARGAGQDVDVELGDGDLDAEFAEGGDGVVDLIERRESEAVVALDADGGDGNACRLELFDERDGAVALGLVLDVVVVVIELGVGVGFVRVLEGFGDVVGADDFVPEGLAQGAVFVEGFVDDVPGLDAAFVAADDGVDVVAHAGEKGVAGEEIAFVVVEDPGGDLAMPDQIMADDEHVVLLAEGDVLVGDGEVVFVRAGDGRSPT